MKVIIDELNTAQTDNYKSMLLQGIGMCLWYNSILAFHIFEQNNWTEPVFKLLFSMMENFKFDFEIRRILFGLTCILTTPPENLPPVC
jgi:hypothetical protein